MSRADRLEVIAELMSALEQVTRAGQEHVMHRMLTILGIEVARARVLLTDPRNMVLMRLLKELDRESRRLCPNPFLFNTGARSAIDILMEADSQRSPF